MRLTIRVPRRWLDLLDRTRGDRSRSDAIRALLDEANPEKRYVFDAANLPPVAPPIAESGAEPAVHHYHRFNKGGVVRYEKGAALHHWECACGAVQVS